MHLPPDPLPFLDLTARIHLPDSSSPSLPVSQSREDGDDFTHGAKFIFALFLTFFILCLGGYQIACSQ